MSSRTKAAVTSALLALAACGQAARITEPSPRGWQRPVRLGPSAGSILGRNPWVGIDAQGRSVALWLEEIQSRSVRPQERLQAAHFDPAHGWGPPQTVTGGDLAENSIGLEVNDRGEAVAMASLWGSWHDAALFTPGLGWSAAVRVKPFETGGWPRPALTQDGRAMALWTQREGALGGISLRAGAISPERGWDPTPTAVAPESAAGFLSFDISVDGRGRAFAVWIQRSLPGRRGFSGIWARRQGESGWDPPTLLAAHPYENLAGGLAIAADREGNALAAWEVDRGLEASRYAADVGWSSPALIGTRWARGPRLCVGERGEAVAVWLSTRGLEAAPFDRLRGWSSAETQGVPVEPIPGSISLPVQDADAGMDDSGEVRVVWERDQRILAGTFTSAGGWSPPVPLLTTARGAAPRIAVNGAGEAVAVWVESVDEGQQIWSARFVP